jgi:hypothetical protein
VILLVGHDVTVAEWVAGKIGTPMCPPYTALGWIDNEGLLRVGFVFFDYQPEGNMDMAVAASGRFTRGIFRDVANYVFVQSGASRLTARIKRRNKRAGEILKRVGFVSEAVCKNYYADDDAVQYRILKAQARRWL